MYQITTIALTNQANFSHYSSKTVTNKQFIH